MSLEDLDGSRKSLEVVLISSIVMGLIGGGGHPQVWRLISFAPFFGSRSPILTEGTHHQVDKFKKDKGQYMMMVKVMVLELFIYYYSAIHCRPLHLGSPV